MVMNIAKVNEMKSHEFMALEENPSNKQTPSEICKLYFFTISSFVILISHLIIANPTSLEMIMIFFSGSATHGIRT